MHSLLVFTDVGIMTFVIMVMIATMCYFICTRILKF